MSDVLEGLEGYTPGPWNVTSGPPACVPSKSVKSGPGGTVYVEDRRRRATIVAEYTYTMANARLIARAPELVEEIRRLREALRDSTDRLECHYSDDEINAQVRRNRALLTEIEEK